MGCSPCHSGSRPPLVDPSSTPHASATEFQREKQLVLEAVSRGFYAQALALSWSVEISPDFAACLRAQEPGGSGVIALPGVTRLDTLLGEIRQLAPAGWITPDKLRLAIEEPCGRPALTIINLEKQRS